MKQVVLAAVRGDGPAVYLDNPFTAAGDQEVVAAYSGDDLIAPSKDSVTVTVRR